MYFDTADKGQINYSIMELRVKSEGMPNCPLSGRERTKPSVEGVRDDPLYPPLIMILLGANPKHDFQMQNLICAVRPCRAVRPAKCFNNWPVPPRLPVTCLDLKQMLQSRQQRVEEFSKLVFLVMTKYKPQRPIKDPPKT